MSSLSVRTHVARDLLQSAMLFKNEKLVIWEYVSNGLQYVGPGTKPVVSVTIDTRRKCITVKDNGTGMGRQDLENFFVMHGENQERKAGRAGRGRFGTGKAAAFGIADLLRVRTVKDGKRNVVELHRNDIERSGDREIPVLPIEQDVPTTEANGTIISIEEIKLRKLDQAAVIRYIERHLARWPNKPEVYVNSHECEYVEPAIAWEEVLLPDDEVAKIIGNVQLSIRVAKSPLDPEMQGIAVHSNGVWLESTLAGVAGQPMAQYIFGHIDVPALDDDNAPIPAFDMSRSMQLNQNNEVVRSLTAFLGLEIDRVRRRLAKEDRARRAEEEAKALEKEAAVIAEMINNDFAEFRDRVAKVKARSGQGHDRAHSGAELGGDDEQELGKGGDTPATETDETGEPGHGDGTGGGGQTPPNLGHRLEHDQNGKPEGTPVGGSKRRGRPTGGFHVDFREMGDESPRASYVAEQRSIFVNLDHPQIKAAKGTGDIQNPVFRRLAYEVAFSEYAIALASELAANNEYLEPSDAIFDIRDTMNRMARRAAKLYEA